MPAHILTFSHWEHQLAVTSGCHYTSLTLVDHGVKVIDSINCNVMTTVAFGHVSDLKQVLHFSVGQCPSTHPWSNIPWHLNHIATLRCDVSLIIIHVSGYFCFSDINISQGSVVTHLRCDGIFYYQFAGNLLLSLLVKEFGESVGIWQS